MNYPMELSVQVINKGKDLGHGKAFTVSLQFLVPCLIIHTSVEL